MPDKEAIKQKCRTSDNKTAGEDERESIDRMGLIHLKRYINDLEEIGLTWKECYSYAKERLQDIFEKKRRKGRRRKPRRKGKPKRRRTAERGSLKSGMTESGR